MEVAYTNRGTMRMCGGDAVAAIEDFNRAVKLNPKAAAIYNPRLFARLLKFRSGEGRENLDQNAVNFLAYDEEV